MQTPRFATALSTRHDVQLAAREAAEQLAEGLGGRAPDLLVLFVTPHHAGEFDDLAARIGELCGARVLIGSSGQSVASSGREVENEPGLALWAVACEDLDMTPFRLEAHQLSEVEVEYTGLPDLSGKDPARTSLILLGDPYTFPMADFLQGLEQHAPGVPVVGGMASGASGPRQTGLFLGGRRIDGGAIGVVLSGGIRLSPVLSQAYRPVGESMVVTEAKGNTIKKIGGKPATKVMMKTLEALPTHDRLLLQNGPILGAAWNAAQSEFEPSDFLAHPIRGVAPQEDAIVIVGQVRRGQTVQFMVRDAAAAGEDLSRQLAAHAGEAPADPHEVGVLLFTCNGRGTHMFSEPNHDISRIQGQLGEEVPTAGFFAMGEIGPVGGKNHLHGFTASVAVYRGEQG
jgi:small ligand-binding sensory domain FIST